MRVLFVHAARPETPFNCSIAALSAYLKQHGHEVSLLVVRAEAREEEVGSALEQVRPDVLAFSYMSCCAEWVHRLIRLGRDRLPEARLIAGGAHPTTYPRETLAALPLDAVGVGEGEQPLLGWIEDPDQARPGILRQGREDPLERWWFEDLGQLPAWDRALFGDCRNAGNRFEEAVGVAFSRGFCPFTCTFCGIDAYRRVNRQPSAGAMRLRPVEAVIAEMRRAREEVPTPLGFASWDEILPLSAPWMDAFASAYREEIDLPFACQLRVEQVTPRLVKQLVRARCEYVVIGVETGHEGYRKRVLDKRFSNDQARQAFRLLREASIGTMASFMVGLPLETPQMLAQTVRLARELQPDELSWKYYTPETGTRLLELCRREELLIEEHVDQVFGGSEPLIRMPRCRPEAMERATRALRQLRKACAAGSPFDFPQDGHCPPRPALELRA